MISYESLEDKPRLEGIEIEGDKTFEDYGLLPLNPDEITEIQLETFGYVLS